MGARCREEETARVALSYRTAQGLQSKAKQSPRGYTSRMSSSFPAGQANFATTHWSLIVRAAATPSPETREALEELCGRYWYPVYAFLRRRGCSAEDARDGTQEFFAALLEKEYLDDADPQRGRFRTFLLMAVSRFHSKEREKQGAEKRGGNRRLLSLDLASGEERYQHEPVDQWTAEKLFARRWALTLLDQSLAQLRQEYVASGKVAVFDELKVYLTGDSGAPPHEQTATKLGIAAGAVKVAVHRLRQKYRDALRAAIAQTVIAPADVESELQTLLAALRGD